MRNIIIILFATVLMVACSQETEEAATTESEASSDAEATTEMTSKSTEASSDEMHSPEVEPLPDWDSLPPIEEVAEEMKQPSEPEDLQPEKEEEKES